MNAQFLLLTICALCNAYVCEEYINTDSIIIEEKQTSYVDKLKAKYREKANKKAKKKIKRLFKHPTKLYQGPTLDSLWITRERIE